MECNKPLLPLNPYLKKDHGRACCAKLRRVELLCLGAHGREALQFFPHHPQAPGHHASCFAGNYLSWNDRQGQGRSLLYQQGRLSHEGSREAASYNIHYCQSWWKLLTRVHYESRIQQNCDATLSCVAMRESTAAVVKLRLETRKCSTQSTHVYATSAQLTLTHHYHPIT